MSQVLRTVATCWISHRRNSPPVGAGTSASLQSMEPFALSPDIRPISTKTAKWTAPTMSLGVKGFGPCTQRMTSTRGGPSLGLMPAAALAWKKLRQYPSPHRLYSCSLVRWQRAFADERWYRRSTAGIDGTAGSIPANPRLLFPAG